MKKKYFDEEGVFVFVWNNADEDGIWQGNDQILAAAFDVTQDEAHELLGELCDGGHLEEVYRGTYAITKWREWDGRSGEKAAW
jgi:hypothetical protein